VSLDKTINLATAAGSNGGKFSVILAVAYPKISLIVYRLL